MFWLCRIWLKSLFRYLIWRTLVFHNILFRIFFAENWSYLIVKNLFLVHLETFFWTEFFIFRKPFALNLRSCDFAWFHACFFTGYPIVSCEWIFYQYVFLLVIRFWVWWTRARARTTWAGNMIFFFLTFQRLHWDLNLWNWCLRCHKFTIWIAIKSTPRAIFHGLSWVLSIINGKSSAEVVNIIIKACEALALNVLLTLFFRLPLD